MSLCNFLRVLTNHEPNQQIDTKLTHFEVALWELRLSKKLETHLQSLPHDGQDLSGHHEHGGKVKLRFDHTPLVAEFLETVVSVRAANA